jgi:hypothetical protein
MTMKAFYAAAAFAMICAPAAAVPLTFTTFQQKAKGYSPIGSSKVVEHPIIKFTNVAQENGLTIDARVTATTIKPNTDFGDGEKGGSGAAGDSGYLPNFTDELSQPSDDLGFCSTAMASTAVRTA